MERYTVDICRVAGSGGLFFAVLLCALPAAAPCRASVITSIDEFVVVSPESGLNAGFPVSASVHRGPSLNSGSATSRALNEDVIALQLGSFGSAVAELSVVPGLDSFVYAPDTDNDVARCIDWQALRTGGFAAYHPENAGCDGNFALLPIRDTADYESRAPYRSLRTRLVVPGLSEYRTSPYFQAIPEVVVPAAKTPTRISERIGDASRL